MRDLVSTDWLAEHLTDSDLVVADVRWNAQAPTAGFTSYLQAHIPGAIFLSLDDELSDRSDLTRGRHPLPNPQRFIEALARHGIGEGTRVVACDDTAGSTAVRLWWMMRWIDADNTALLDGGLAKWLAEGRAVESGQPRQALPHSRPLQLNLDHSLAATREEIESRHDLLLIDARAVERYRGEVEPIDTRAGHIPGAINVPYTKNLTGGAAPVFRRPEELRELYAAAGADTDSEIICYCGSGVTACHDILALTLAGFDRVRLYPGSWSEWICHNDA